MKVCVAYRGLSYMDSFKNHHGTCTFSMLDVIDNHFKMLVDPLEMLGHEVVFAISTNASPVLDDIVEKLGRCVYVSTVGCDQMDRGRCDQVPSARRHARFHDAMRRTV